MQDVEVGDWLLFPDMGAYSWHSCSTNFNGFDVQQYQVFDANNLSFTADVQQYKVFDANNLRSLRMTPR